MNASIVSDGRIRLMRAMEEKARLRQAQLLSEVEARYAEKLLHAAAWRRWLVRRKIRKEIAARLRAEFPSQHALFLRR